MDGDAKTEQMDYEESVIVIFVAVLVAVNGVFMFTTLVVLCC